MSSPIYIYPKQPGALCRYAFQGQPNEIQLCGTNEFWPNAFWIGFFGTQKEGGPKNGNGTMEKRLAKLFGQRKLLFENEGSMGSSLEARIWKKVSWWEKSSPPSRGRTLSACLKEIGLGHGFLKVAFGWRILYADGEMTSSTKNGVSKQSRNYVESSCWFSNSPFRRVWKFPIPFRFKFIVWAPVDSVKDFEPHWEGWKLLDWWQGTKESFAVDELSIVLSSKLGKIITTNPPVGHLFFMVFC